MCCDRPSSTFAPWKAAAAVAGALLLPEGALAQDDDERRQRPPSARGAAIPPPDAIEDLAGAPVATGPNLPPILHKGPRDGRFFFMRQHDAPRRKRRPDRFDPLKNIALDRSGEINLSLSGQLRVRALDQNRQSLLLAPQPDLLGIQFREEATADLRLGKHVRVIGELVWGQVAGRDFVTPVLNRQDNGPEVSQAFVELRDKLFGGETGAIIGRQKISLGSNTIFSLQLAQNIERNFDAVRLYHARPKFRVDLIAARPTRPAFGSFNDVTDTDVAIWGSYVALALPRVPQVSLNLGLSYFNYSDADSALLQQRTTERRDLFGARLWGRLGPVRLDWTYDRQHGSIAGRPIRAFSLITNTRIPFPDVPLAPTLIVQGDILSGGSRDGGVVRTYNPIYGAQRHATFGNYLGFTNLVSPGAAISILPARTLNVRFGARAFWRYSVEDGFAVAYGTAATASRIDARFIGVLPTLSARWQIDDHLSLRVATNRLLSGGGYKAAGQHDLQTNLVMLHFLF